MDTHRWAAEDSILALVDMKRLLENDLIPYVDSSMPVIIGGTLIRAAIWIGRIRRLLFISDI